MNVKKNWDNNRPKWECRVNWQCSGNRKTMEEQENKENGKIIVSMERSPLRCKKFQDETEEMKIFSIPKGDKFSLGYLLIIPISQHPTCIYVNVWYREVCGLVYVYNGDCDGNGKDKIS